MPYLKLTLKLSFELSSCMFIINGHYTKKQTPGTPFSLIYQNWLKISKSHGYFLVRTQATGIFLGILLNFSPVTFTNIFFCDCFCVTAKVKKIQLWKEINNKLCNISMKTISISKSIVNHIFLKVSYSRYRYKRVPCF